MFIDKKTIYISAAIITVISGGYFFLTPDFYSAITRVIGIGETPGQNSLIKTYKFVEEVERIRGKYEVGKTMTLESAAERDFALDNLLLTKNESKELLVYLRIYGKAMYLSSEGTGTYQCVFFSVLRKLADKADREPDLKQQLLKIKESLNLNDTDGGEYSAIIKHESFP